MPEGGGASVALSGATVAHAQTPLDDPDPNFYPYEDVVPGEYIVTFADGAYAPPDDMIGDEDAGAVSTPPSSGTNGVSPTPPDAVGDAATVADDLCGDYGATLLDTYEYGSGFHCSMAEDDARAMSHDPRVACVESNMNAYACTTRLNSGWALDRIDQRPPVHPGAGLPNDAYTANATGAGVDAWIVDTGVWAGAPEFDNAPGRVVPEFPNAHGRLGDTAAGMHPTYSTNIYTSSDEDVMYGDHAGHGTIVAELVGGKTWGVAPRVTLHAVKVTDDTGNGTMAWFLAGMNYVAKHLSTLGAR